MEVWVFCNPFIHQMSQRTAAFGAGHLPQVERQSDNFGSMLSEDNESFSDSHLREESDFTALIMRIFD